MTIFRKLFNSLIFVSCLFHFSAFSEVATLPDRDPIVVECDSACDVRETVLGILKKRFHETVLSQRFDVRIQGNVSYSFSLKEFIDTYQIDVIQGKSRNGIVVYDAPLECQYDDQYSCDDWMKVEFVNYIVTSINNSEITLTVTDEFINGNNEARRLVIAVATTNAIGRIAQKVAAALNTTLMAGLTESASAVVINELLQSTDWYKTDLQPGDKLVFKGGKMTIERSGSGSSGGSPLAGTENYNGGYNYGNWLFSIDTFNCHIHYTGRTGVLVAQTVCY
ncbi:hypothetical protein KIH87_12285 [Paraneptunicella aestuarii]|uniref:hypothetical protein n=1 Tax=Paraneptunicella aestuarii TaxID=2831148 RepID=UPI001E45F544|nr:hypothetical protein [Paraneptunicella aestuarii]UAA37490.1 hypothetical protein KIH87_12285 [Paraneptunicella aestuarii]